jgi:hypothetical protein
MRAISALRFDPVAADQISRGYHVAGHGAVHLHLSGHIAAARLVHHTADRHSRAQGRASAFKATLDAVQTLPSPECEVFIAHVGGAMAHVPANATAWSNRNAHFIMNVHARWREKAQDSTCVAWARQHSQASVHAAAKPQCTNPRASTGRTRRVDSSSPN